LHSVASLPRMRLKGLEVGRMLGSTREDCPLLLVRKLHKYIYSVKSANNKFQ
jgi:hypothetical protein